MNVIVQHYKSREVLLQLLKKQGYQVSGYEGFSVNEIDAMTRNATLDMFVSTPQDSQTFRKMYIKYEFGSLSTQLIENAIEDLFQNDPQEKYSLRAGIDSLVILSKDEPNDKMQNYLVTLFETRQLFVSIIPIKRLLFNVLEHDLQPKHMAILTEKETEELVRKYHIANVETDLPEISRFDPVALALFMKPGEVCRFVRDSPVAIVSEYYRVCK